MTDSPPVGGEPVGPACDHVRVGVVLTRDDGRVLLVRRPGSPPGLAPVDGHLDARADPWTAAMAEVSALGGLSVSALQIVAEGWRPDVCRRPVDPADRLGHQWTVFTGQAAGALAPSDSDPADAGWADRAVLQLLADRTTAYARGTLTDRQFAAQPGLDPVWLQWLIAAELIDPLRAADIQAADWLIGIPFSRQ